jgi:hypothetical protein
MLNKNRVLDTFKNKSMKQRNRIYKYCSDLYFYLKIPSSVKKLPS